MDENYNENGGYQNPQYQQPYGQYQQNQNPNVNAYAYGQPDESGIFPETKLAMKNGLSARVKLSDWMKIDCIGLLNLIPFVGSVAVIVIYCIMAFGNKTAASVKTRIQANLIWSLIVLAVYIVLIIVLVGIGFSIMDYVGNNY